jgi:teichuronic acid biosynthesis glycosyltransferase TuaC
MVKSVAQPPEPAAVSGEPQAKAAPLRILSLSCVYPNPNEPELGLFVRSRLHHLSALAEVKVVAPIAFIRHGRWPGDKRKVSFRRTEEKAEILHPIWIYPPGGTWINAACLALRVFPVAIRMRKQFRFDVIDAHFGYPDGISACLLAAALGVPFTVTLRGNETMHAHARICGWIMKWALRRAARVITVSRRLSEFALSAGVCAEKVSVIPNGIENGVFYPRDRMACRVKHGIAREARVILSAGSLIERKGHHRVLHAVSALKRQGSPCELLLAGGPGREGQFEECIHQLVRELGLERSVRLEGQVAPQQMAELMSASDVLCLASTREGWPNVIHEAMACGLPVIATDVGAVPEMMPSPEYGLVVPVGDQEALAGALLRALDKDWDRQAISAWAQSRSWQQVAREVFAQMEIVVAGAKKGRVV